MGIKVQLYVENCDKPEISIEYSYEMLARLDNYNLIEQVYQHFKDNVSNCGMKIVLRENGTILRNIVYSPEIFVSNKRSQKLELKSHIRELINDWRSSSNIATRT